MEPVTVAAVQAAPVLLDRDATIARVVTLAGKAAAQGARLIVFPEAFVPGYPDWVWRTRPWDAHACALYARLLDQALVAGSPAMDTLAQAAAQLGAWLSVGVSERDEAGSTLYNTLLHFAPDGKLAARHRKLMPTGGERLVWGMGDGSTLDVIDTGFGRLGGLICWENYMPLARAALYARGIDIYLAPTWDNSDVEAHLHDPAVRVVEVDVSRRAYDDWHIDRAVLWNVYTDLKDADYRLASRPALEQLLRTSGIRPDTTVVCYGYAPAMGFWLMKLYGHRDVRILDCSRGTWQRAGRPCSSAPAAPTATSYPLRRPDGRIRAGHAAVRQAIADPGSTLLDVRTEAEFRGERFWPSGGMEPGGRAGHVPTAVHQPIDGLQDDQGAFRPTAELCRVFPAVRPGDPGELITYCTIGGRASTAWFALTYLLGHDHVRVYDGSWAEWGRMTGTPVAP